MVEFRFVLADGCVLAGNAPSTKDPTTSAVSRNPEIGPWHVDESSLKAGQKTSDIPLGKLKSGDLHGPGQGSSQSVDLGQVAIFSNIASLWSISHWFKNEKSDRRGVFEPGITKTRE